MLVLKMLRDIKTNLSQFITIFLMVLIGVMAYVGIEAYMSGMKYTADAFYKDSNLQDLVVIGKNFTNEDLDKIKRIDNVREAERRVSFIASIENSKEKNLSVNFIESNNISKFYVFDGEKFDKDKKGLWIDKFYSDENNLKVGDTITFIYDGYKLDEKILGIINVPDHVYDIKDEKELYPDHKNYGYVYLSINEFPESMIKDSIMKEMNIDSEDIFNQVMPNFNYKDYLPFNYILVDVNKKSNVKSVKTKIDEDVSNALAIMKIEDTPSYATYQGEIDEGKSYVGVFSGLFLFIAMLSVITTMTRVISKQRIQIGTLKALGFKNMRINLHYIGYGFWISLFAAICGILLGRYFIGNVFIGSEMAFFQIPNGRPVVELSSYVVALIVVLIVSIITYLTCRKELKENPADSLRIQMPKVEGRTLNITSGKLFKRMNFSNKWNLRDILRNKIRTLTGIVGVAACCMLIVCVFGMLDSLNHFLDLQFSGLYNFKYKLTLKQDITNERIDELVNEYGDHTSMSLGIDLKNGDSSNVFVTDADNYVRFVDGNDEYIKINSNKGVYITRKLADSLNLKVGDYIEWRIYGKDKIYKSKIIGLNKDPQNQNITMTREYLESKGIGYKYKADSIYTNKDLSNIETISSVDIIQNIKELRSSMDSMLNTMKTMVILIIVIAVLLGTVIIYNLGILSYTEKEYQFATLKVLGFGDKKIKNIFIQQNNWIAVVSIIIGLPAGYYLIDWLFQAALAETYDFNAYVLPITYVISALGTFIVSYVVSLYLSRKINNIDMVSSLKGNE